MSATTTPYVLILPERLENVRPEPYHALVLEGRQPDRLATLYAPELASAYDQGAQAALTAATWAADGMDGLDVRARLMDWQDGEDGTMPYPDLSGEWADQPTPISLAAELLDGLDVEHHHHPDHGDVVEALATAWEAGRDDVLERACTAELAARLPDPGQVVEAELERSTRLDDLDRLEALDRLAQGWRRVPSIPDVERPGLVQATRLAELEAHGVRVAFGQDGHVVVRADASAPAAWARGDWTGTTWPAGVLGHDLVDGLVVVLSPVGDLERLELEGLTYCNGTGVYAPADRVDADGDPLPNAPVLDLEAAELGAFLSDVLVDVLPIDHGAWWDNVGRHLDDDDQRRLVRQELDDQAGRLEALADDVRELVGEAQKIRERASAADLALAAFPGTDPADLEASATDLVANLAHRLELAGLDPDGVVARGLDHWRVESRHQ